MSANQLSKHWLLSALLCLVCFMGGAILSDVAAQNGSSKTVQGVVRDAATNEPVAGAQVWIKDSSYGTISDSDGRYSITYSGKYATLSVSFFGYEDASVDLTGKNQKADVLLKEGSLAIEETVVVGYGTQKKASVIGAITTVMADELQAPVANISNVIGGQVAGVVSFQNNGEPGASSTFWIRGVSSFSGSTSPLCLVDGVERSLDLVDPNDIKEFSVLKDASATAIYGVRGANGVILITTHSGTESKAKVSARYEVGMVSPTKVPEMANAQQFMEIVNDAYGSQYYSPEVMQKHLSRENLDVYPNVDWMDMIFKDLSTSHRANVQVTGGNSTVKYYVGAGLYTEGGLYKEDSSVTYGTEMRYTKYNFRANVDIQVEKNTTLNINLATIFEQRNYPGTSSGDIFTNALRVPSVIYPHKFSNGYSAGPGSATGHNPYSLVTETGYKQKFDNNAQALVGLTHDFGWLTPGLKANAKVSFDAYNGHQFNHTRDYDHYQIMKNADGTPQIDEETGDYVYHLNSGGSQTLSYGKSAWGNRRIYLEASLNYARSFGNHNVTGLFLFQQSSKNMLADNAGNSQASLPYRNQGIAGRITYDYASRYFFEFNAGYNGSENFSPGRRFGFFPSVALGYLISEEPWWGNVKNVVDMLKIRGSWGLVGNDQIGGNRRFIYLGTVAGGASAWFGTNNVGHSGIKEGEVANPNVGWEQAEKMDIGIDLSLFGKLKIQADLFMEERTGIFLQRKSIPGYMGISVNPYVNIGEMHNSGIDLSGDYRQSFGDLTLTAKGTFTFARNVLVNADEAPNEWAYQNSTGQAYWQRYGFVSDGLFQSWEDIESHADQSIFNPQPGDIKYVDINGDGKINSYDTKPIGYRDIPEIIYGFGVSAEYKGFDLSVFFQGNSRVSMNMLAAKYMILGITSANNKIENANVLADLYQNYWTPERPDAKYPRLTWLNESQNNTQPSDFWFKDCSYIRLQNVEFGYTFPKKWTSKMRMSALRLYVQGQNLLTFSDFKLWDPNLNGAGGGTVYSYPTTRVLSFGVSASF